MRKKIKNILQSHELLRLATLDQDGFPNVRSVDYAICNNDEWKIYFTTFKNTDKVAELARLNKVYIVVDKPAMTIEELSKIKYIRGTGKAFLVTSPEEAQQAMDLLLGKYAFLKDLPGDPSMMNIYRIELDQVRITDNSLGFGTVEIYQY